VSQAYKHLGVAPRPAFGKGSAWQAEQGGYIILAVESNNSMIAITFALPAESSRLIARAGSKRRASGDTGIIYGDVNGRSVAIFHTGVGHKICQKNIGDFLRVERPEFLISSGFAGGVRNDLHVGDLFLAENFSNRELLSAARRILTKHRVHTGNLFTSRSITDSVTQRNVVAATSAAAVDMETETIARACASSAIRMVSLRVISDSLSEPLPAPSGVLFDVERQKTNYQKLSPYLLKHPTTLWRLIQFARRIGEARRVLTEAILDIVRTIEL
jgi:nucleoside phosphorylase